MFLSLVSNYHQVEGLIPSGKRLHNYGKSPCSMGKSIISMVIFHSYFDITRGYVPTKTANHIVNPGGQVFPRCAREMAAMRRGWVTASAWAFPSLFGGFLNGRWRNHEEIMRKWWENHGNMKNDWQMMGEYIDLYGIDLWDYCGEMIDALSKFQNVAAFNYPSIHIIWISLKSR